MELIQERKNQTAQKLSELSTLQEALQVIIDVVSDVTKADIKGKTRKREHTDARIIYSYLATKYVKKASSVVIGDMINRDHATVLHHRKKAEEFIEVDSGFRHKLNESEEMLLSIGEETLLQARINYHKNKAKKYEDILKKAS